MAEQSMRILQVMRAPVGGLFRHVADLTQELSRRGHQVGLIVDSLASDAQTSSKLEALRPFTALGLHRMPMPRLVGIADLTTPARIGRLARELDVSVLHGHGAKGGVSARLARGRGQAALYTPHGGVLHFSPHSAAGRLFKQIERALLGRTDAIIFESAFARDAYSRQIVTPTCPAPIVHNGLRPDEFAPVASAADAADFVFVGELRDLKGIHVLVEALASLDGAPTLIMAGGGDGRAALEAQIERLALKDRVTLAGVQPAPAMFARGRCLVVPSLAESLPYIVLEAVAAGMPLIATRVGGIPEIFGPTAASLVPAGNAAALAAAMAGFVAAPYAARAEAAERLDYVAPRFSIAAMTDAIEALYRDSLSGRTRKR